MVVFHSISFLIENILYYRSILYYIRCCVSFIYYLEWMLTHLVVTISSLVALKKQVLQMKCVRVDCIISQFEISFSYLASQTDKSSCLI